MKLQLCVVVMMSATSALSAGNVYAVMPTQGAGVTSEADLTTRTMRLALQEQSLALVPQVAVEQAVTLNQASCAQSALACGRLVGEAVGATHVVVSELWDQAGTFELKVALVDVRLDALPQWVSSTTTSSESLGALSKSAVLTVVSPGALSGALRVQLTPGAEIFVGGVLKDRTPLVSPLSLSAGNHEVEIRLAKAKPFRKSITVASGETQTLTLCTKTIDGAELITDSCGGGEAPLPVLQVAGGAALGVGVLSAGGAAAFFALAQGSYGALEDAADKRDADGAEKAATALTVQQAAFGTLAVTSGALLALGAASMGASMMLE
jgi:hypothetical protein